MKDEEFVCGCRCGDNRDNRRGFLSTAAAVLSAAQFVLRPSAAWSAEEEISNAAPQPGDFLTYQTKAKRGPRLKPADLKKSAKQLLALPVDSASGVVRDGSRFNQIMLTQLDPQELDETTRARAAEGVVAYSAMCTHDACPVSSWDGKAQHYVCPCHQSRFDPKAGGNLVSGPAYRPLPALPLKLADSGELVVAEPFTARVGGGR
ncbi:ubiquinol-cytochrome c reductase iron-sulfur subunit [Marinivivus vitaminiproducens]|uniref:QcrA and Rieske domain-containing protein n=1 Tax=Marinivivus vitaminiproducens TaxID=3035935 RepID=UPI0027A804A2|nr:Rieske (2Fe-2S) protein [Geminicoccaceae bacterium SCSIO 64248]